MNIIAIDPGTTKSGWVHLEGRAIRGGAGNSPNGDILRWIAGWSRTGEIDAIVCEWIQNQGMSVGQTTFHTCRWVGRFEQAAIDGGLPFQLVYRGDVKLHICGAARANDTNIRRAICDLYPHTGGGAKPWKGTKEQPGPLFGVTTHQWQALAVGLTFQEFKELKIGEYE